MSEPESLDEQALNEDICAVVPNDRFLPDEYQHPEDTMEVFEQYETLTDEYLRDNQSLPTASPRVAGNKNNLPGPQPAPRVSPQNVA